MGKGNDSKKLVFSDTFLIAFTFYILNVTQCKAGGAPPPKKKTLKIVMINEVCNMNRQKTVA